MQFPVKRMHRLRKNETLRRMVRENHLTVEGTVYQAGTLSGNPVAMAAGYETVKILKESDAHRQLETKAAKLEAGLQANLEELDLHFSMNRVASMLSLFFTRAEVTDFLSAATSQTEFFTYYYNEMLKRGIYLAPSQYEAAFLSLAHSDADIEAIIGANYESLKSILDRL